MPSRVCPVCNLTSETDENGFVRDLQGNLTVSCCDETDLLEHDELEEHDCHHAEEDACSVCDNE